MSSNNNLVSRTSSRVSAEKVHDNNVSRNRNSFAGFLLIIVLVLLTINTIRIMSGSSNVTFASFLDFLGNYNAPIDISFDFTAWTISGEWVILDGLRIFLNFCGQIVGFGVFMVTNLVNVVVFLAKFVGYLFG